MTSLTNVRRVAPPKGGAEDNTSPTNVGCVAPPKGGAEDK